MPALKYLVRISMGPNEETFKICVEPLGGTFPWPSGDLGTIWR